MAAHSVVPPLRESAHTEKPHRDPASEPERQLQGQGASISDKKPPIMLMAGSKPRIGIKARGRCIQGHAWKSVKLPPVMTMAVIGILSTLPVVVMLAYSVML